MKASNKLLKIAILFILILFVFILGFLASYPVHNFAWGAYDTAKLRNNIKNGYYKPGKEEPVLRVPKAQLTISYTNTAGKRILERLYMDAKGYIVKIRVENGLIESVVYPNGSGTEVLHE